MPYSWCFGQDLLWLAAQIWRHEPCSAERDEELGKENQRLKKIVADLELDKLILKESLDYLKPKA